MMNQIDVRQITGWIAAVHAVVTVLSFSALILFFMLGGFWGGLNDGLSVIWALSLIPILWFLFNLIRASNQPLSLVSIIIGVASLLVFAVLQFLLVVGRVQYEQTIRGVMASYGLFGVSLMVLGLAAFGARLLPSGWIWAMFVFGFGLVLSMIGFWIGREQNPLAAAGFALAFLADVVWSIWLARLLLAARSLAV